MTTHSQQSEDDAVTIDHDEDAVVIDRDDYSNYNPEQILPESSEEIKKIRRWLQATDYAHQSGEFRKHLASYMLGTATWLTSSDTYRSWVDGHEHGMLWIKGIPGSGKSVVAAHLVDLLTRSNPGSPVLYFFFRQIIQANHEPAALLRDWLDQILEYSPPLQKYLKQLVEDRRSLSSLATEDLVSCLKLAFAGLPGKVFCVADALDEMDEGNGRFLRALVALGAWEPSKAKILITSRPVPSIEGLLRNANLLRLRLAENEVDVDIANYVEHGLQASDIPNSKWDQIREAIPGRANGIFLYAKLAMHAFVQPGASTEGVLRTLPVDLHAMYTRLLREHSVRSRVPGDIQLLILQSVTHTTRPLRLIELAEMISVTYQPSDRSETERDLRSTKDLVRAAAGPLLEILPDETVCVIHHSFTEYLKCMTRSETDGDYPVLRPGPTHGRLALSCLEYLQAGCLDSVKVVSADDSEGAVDAETLYNRSSHYEYYGRDEQVEREEQRIRLQWPFSAYAMANWHMHIARSCAANLSQTQVNSALDRFFENEQRLKAWLKLQWVEGGDGISITPLHIAARYGLISYAGHLVSEKIDVHAVDTYGRTPLWWAAHSGHSDIVRLLVQAGADPDVDDKVAGLKPLHEAADNNHAGVVRVLLEAGVNPLTEKTREYPGMRCGNAPTSTGHTALMYACHNGHYEALDAFLPFLTDSTIVYRALAWSARHGRSNLVKRILDQPDVDINAKVRGDTALYLACKAVDRDTIVTLLEAGADPTILCEDSGDEFGGIGSGRHYYPDKTKDETRGFTALHALCSVGRRSHMSKADPDTLQEVFPLLLQKGANIYQQNISGSTALHNAVHSIVLIRLLLHAGADANAANDAGETPLHEARSPELVQLLVEEGHADINKVISSNGRSPLLCMLDGHSTETVHKLLEYHPDITIRDKKGNGPLHIVLAQYLSDTTIVKSLLSSGADPNERNCDGETPMMVMRLDNQGSVPTMDVLLAAGADINARDPLGMTILTRALGSYSSASRSDHWDVKSLLERGADLQSCDRKGRTLLHQAVSRHESWSGFTYGDKVATRLDFVLGLGLDAQATDYRGNTLFHEAAMRTGVFDSYSGPLHIPLWEQLLALGLDIDQGNYQGRTALHMLAATVPGDHRPFSFKLGHFGPLEFAISTTKSIDQKDYQGLTALHLASTVSEYATKMLLDAGADPSLTTLDGLTPLSLAIRTRNSNIVGLLLEASKNHNSAPIRTRDEKGRSPLYYASRSGRPESLRLLLDAGADASQEDLYHACAEFEEEDRLWNQKRHLADAEVNQSASGLTIDDTTRPVTTSTGYQRQLDVQKTTRLEEVIDMLQDHQCVLSGSAQDKADRSFKALNTAAKAGHDYTFACLLRTRNSSPKGQKRVFKTVALFAEEATKAYEDAQVSATANLPGLDIGSTSKILIIHLLKRRQFRVIRTLFDKGVDFLAGEDSTNLQLFIENGYASLLDEIGSLEVERKLAEGKWHAFGDKTKPGLHAEVDLEATQNDYNQRSYDPLLFKALHRELPNMEVVRLLVEKFHVDINEYSYERGWSDGKYNVSPQETALHYLARGTHWWHVALAMPFLIAKRANIHARDSAGCTPLHIAFGGPDRYIGPFHKDAARILAAAGADLNAQNNIGRSCLASTAGDLGMVQLLIKHGVSIGADALLMAIKAKQFDVLQTLLDAGADPNMRCKAPEPQSGTKKRRSPDEELYDVHWDIAQHETYPLYAAAGVHGARDKQNNSPVEEKRKRAFPAVQLVTALLQAGADPYATFYKRNPDFEDDDEDTEDETVRALLLRKKNRDTEFEKVTILHDLLEEDELVHPFFNLATLDPNRRDAKGRTVLMAACHSPHGLGAPIDSLYGLPDPVPETSLPSFLDHLLALGADPLATDNEGRNMLQHMFDTRGQYRNGHRNHLSLIRLASDYPALLNQADMYGKTPLHLALRQAVLQCDTIPAQALLKAGANPSAIDNDGNGALHILAFRIYDSSSIRALFTELVHKGLDINQVNNRGETPIFNLNKHIPASLSQVRCAPKSGEDRSTASEALALFENAGADLFARDSEGRGLLHIAARETYEAKHTEDSYRGIFMTETERRREIKPQEESIVRFEVLVKKGLDPLAEDGLKRTALDVAAACGKESILKLFEKDGGGIIGGQEEDSGDGLGF